MDIAAQVALIEVVSPANVPFNVFADAAFAVLAVVFAFVAVVSPICVNFSFACDLESNVNNLTQATTTYCVFLLIGTGFPVPFFIQDHYLN